MPPPPSHYKWRGHNKKNLKLLRNGLCQNVTTLVSQATTGGSYQTKQKLQRVYDLLVGHCTSNKNKNKRSMPAPFVWNEKIANLIGHSGETHEIPLVLAHADYSKPFQLHTDASTTGLGAVLYQNQDGMDRVVAYASHSLKQSEKNYPAHKLKFLALK